jgi:protein TonB
MRAFILIALLGGAALAGGLYFGGGIPNFASAPETEQAAEIASTTPYDEPGDVLDEPIGVPLEESATPAPAPDRRAEARREEARREEARREAARPREEPDAPPPAPTTSWAANNASGGPTSLSPGSSAPSTNVTPPTPVPLSPTVTAAATPTNRGTTRPAGNVVWAARPSARRVADLYPERASRDGVGGRVELDCSVRSNQSLACSVANESPAGLGFGRAALNAAGSYRAQAWLSDGTDSTGARTRVVFQFNAPEQ